MPLCYNKQVVGAEHRTDDVPGPVVQLVRTLACHARGRGFESHPDRHLSLGLRLILRASVAQLVEQETENLRVVGSIPTGGTIP